MLNRWKKVALFTFLGIVIAVSVVAGFKVWSGLWSNPRWSFIFRDAPKMETYGVGTRVDIHTGEFFPNEGLVHFPLEADLTQVNLKGTLWLHSDLPRAETYALVALMDYIQTPIVISETAKSVNIVQIESYSRAKIDFELTIPNQEGRHKLVLLIFQAPEVHRLDDKFRFLTDGMCFYQVLDVTIGDDEILPRVVYQQVPETKPNVSQIEFNGLLINRDAHNNRTAWLTETVRPQQTLTYYVHLGNDGHSRAPYALVAFLDWQQIPIAEDESKVVFGLIEENGRLTLPTEVQIPPKDSIHELQIIYVPDPYGTVDHIIPSLRIGLVQTP